MPKEEAAQGKLSVDVGFWGGAVPGNIDQMAPLWDKGVFGFKCFTAHSGIDEYGYLGYEGVKEGPRRARRARRRPHRPRRGLPHPG